MIASRVDPLVLERLAVGAWVPDEVERRHGWLLRAAEGFTGRANSALVLNDPGDRLDAVLDDVTDWYRRRGLPALVAIPRPVLDDLHERLRARGWVFHHGARVLFRALAGLPGRPGAGAVQVSDRADPEWLARYHYHGGDVPEVGVRMLTRGDRIALAAVHDGVEPVAIGRGSVVDAGVAGTWLGVNAVETAPSHRRRGLASDVLSALAAWAADHGADRAFLQVDLANDVARTVYLHAGFVEHHTYEYLQPPARE